MYRSAVGILKARVLPTSFHARLQSINENIDSSRHGEKHDESLFRALTFPSRLKSAFPDPPNAEMLLEIISLYDLLMIFL
jgi:hypothetical protein